MDEPIKAVIGATGSSVRGPRPWDLLKCKISILHSQFLIYNWQFVSSLIHKSTDWQIPNCTCIVFSKGAQWSFSNTQQKWLFIPNRFSSILSLQACKDKVDAICSVFAFDDPTSFRDIPYLMNSMTATTENPANIVIGTKSVTLILRFLFWWWTLQIVLSTNRFVRFFSCQIPGVHDNGCDG